MSAGHRKGYRHSKELERETERILALPAIKAYMAKPYKEDCLHDIPLTGGSSIKGDIYYLDRRLSRELREFVLQHERVEKAVREVMGKGYSRAHEIATCAEKMLVEKRKRNWDDYKHDVGQQVRHDEKEKGKLNIPKDLDPGPYKGSGEESLLRGKRDSNTRKQ